MNWSNHNKTNGPSSWCDIFFTEVHFWAGDTLSMLTWSERGVWQSHVPRGHLHLLQEDWELGHLEDLKHCNSLLVIRSSDMVGWWWQLMSSTSTMDIRSGKNSSDMEIYNIEQDQNWDMIIVCLSGECWAMMALQSSVASPWHWSHSQVSTWPTYYQEMLDWNSPLLQTVTMLIQMLCVLTSHWMLPHSSIVLHHMTSGIVFGEKRQIFYPWFQQIL